LLLLFNAEDVKTQGAESRIKSNNVGIARGLAQTPGQTANITFIIIF